MSVYIAGIGLPKRREEAYLLAIDSDGKVYNWTSEELPHLKAVEVPEHGRLIDADALPYEDVHILLTDDNELGLPISDIENAPTIIPASEEVKDNA